MPSKAWASPSLIAAEVAILMRHGCRLQLRSRKQTWRSITGPLQCLWAAVAAAAASQWKTQKARTCQEHRSGYQNRSPPMLPANASASMKAGILDSVHEWRSVDLLLPILPVSNAAAFSLKQAALLEQGACQPQLAFAPEWPPSHLTPAGSPESRKYHTNSCINGDQGTETSVSCSGGSMHDHHSSSSSSFKLGGSHEPESFPADSQTGSSSSSSHPGPQSCLASSEHCQQLL